MAVPTTSTEIRYTGTGTTGPFPVTFPFLDTSHILASVMADADSDEVALSEFSVSRLADGSGGSVTLAVAISDPQILVIKRRVPLTQPSIFPTSGPFPAKAVETALDRLEMQVQQLNKALLDLGGEAGTPTAESGGGNKAWANVAARATEKPDFAGQLGVQRSNQTVWVAQSTAAGDWLEYRPQRANKLTLGYAADAGDYGAEQIAIADLFNDWNPDALLFGGGNNYNGVSIGYGGRTNYDNDWLIFIDWINAGKVYPALGNVDVDYDGWEDRHAAKFPYLPQTAGGRYYRVTLGGGLVDLFVIHSGFNSLRDVVEPDGNDVDSVQHAWLVAELATSSARWKIAMFHAPPVTLCATAGTAATELAWPEFAQMDLILCGNAHVLEILRWRETMLCNFSASVDDGGAVGTDLVGDTNTGDRGVFTNDAVFGCGRIIATEERLEVEAYKNDATLLYAGTVESFPAPDQTAVVLTVADESDGHTYQIITDGGILSTVLIS